MTISVSMQEFYSGNTVNLKKRDRLIGKMANAAVFIKTFGWPYVTVARDGA